MTDLTAAFARDMIGLRQARLTPADYDQLARLIFDYAVCAYSGSLQPTSAAVRLPMKPKAGPKANLSE